MRAATGLLTFALVCATSSARAQTATQRVTIRVVPVTRVAADGNSYSVVSSDPNARITVDRDGDWHVVAAATPPVAYPARASAATAPPVSPLSPARTVTFTIVAAP